MNTVKKLSDNTKQYLDIYYQIVDEMNQRMRSVEPSDSISRTFIEQMIPHHEAAIAMSENILNFTTDIAIEQLAKTIITEQERQIQTLQNMSTNCSEITNQERDILLYQREFINILDNMINRMNRAHSGNNLNLNYISAMIPHQEGAIQFAKNVIKYDICDELNEYASNLITSQSLQVTLLKTLLRRLSGN